MGAWFARLRLPLITGFLFAAVLVLSSFYYGSLAFFMITGRNP
jgi:hypothetical protein